jgi:hypothetical protein
METNIKTIKKVEKMEINKYISLEENNEAGQKADGTWYIKKLMFKDANDLKTKISECNQVCNEANKKTQQKQKKKD